MTSYRFTASQFGFQIWTIKPTSKSYKTHYQKSYYFKSTLPTLPNHLQESLQGYLHLVICNLETAAYLRNSSCRCGLVTHLKGTPSTITTMNPKRHHTCSLRQKQETWHGHRRHNMTQPQSPASYRKVSQEILSHSFSRKHRSALWPPGWQSSDCHWTADLQSYQSTPMLL